MNQFRPSIVLIQFRFRFLMVGQSRLVGVLIALTKSVAKVRLTFPFGITKLDQPGALTREIHLNKDESCSPFFMRECCVTGWSLPLEQRQRLIISGTSFQARKQKVYDCNGQRVSCVQATQSFGISVTQFLPGRSLRLTSEPTARIVTICPSAGHLTRLPPRR